MSKRDEFIAIVNTFKAASPAITDEQRKGLLRQARQQYGLSFEEARQILKASGLVVGDVVNYFEVLGLAVDELQNQSDAAIATRVDTAHKELYSASLRAGGLPRPDGKTQEQWRTVLNQARDVLKDPPQRREHLATLQPDGEVPDTPSRETTRPIFKFSNGDEATSILQLAALMEKHPQEAAIALYRGYLEQSLGGAGEMRLAEAARTVAELYVKTPEFGLSVMVQLLRLGRKVRQRARTRFGEVGSKLEVDPQIGHPVPKVSHTSINFGKVDRKSKKTVRVEITNAGRGFHYLYVYVTVELAKAMPGLRLSSTSIRGNTVLTVTLDASRLAVNQTHNTALVINMNGIELRVPISCVPVDVAAPSTSSSQDFSFNPPSEESYANSTSSSQDPATTASEKSTAKTRAVGWICAAAISLGILAMFIAPRIMDAPQRERDRVSKARFEIGYLKTALVIYAVDVGDYPTTEQGLDALWRAPSPTPQNWSGPYVERGNFLDPWNNAYVYRYPGTRPGYDYELYSLGKDGRVGGENFDADITNWETR